MNAGRARRVSGAVAPTVPILAVDLNGQEVTDDRAATAAVRYNRPAGAGRAAARQTT
jgi:hypothetical protein